MGVFERGLSLDSKKAEIKCQSIIDGPFIESKEAITGLFVFEAENFEKAKELALSCPTLKYDKIEIYENPTN